MVGLPESGRQAQAGSIFVPDFETCMHNFDYLLKLKKTLGKSPCMGCQIIENYSKL